MTHRVAFLLLLLASPALGQINNDLAPRTISVRVVLPDRDSCDAQIRASLVSASGMPFGQSSVHGDCVVQFSDVPRGVYHLVVSGQGFTDTDSDKFEVGAGDTQGYQVRLNQPAKSRQQSSAALVSAAELNIPAKARKEFNHAEDFMATQEWQRAMEKLQHAIAIYPRYVEAYTNLGVVYARLGDRVREKESLEKAISLDDHFAPAYVNLARAEIAEQDFPHAETLLDRATAIDPTDVVTMVLLANVELRTRHFDQVISTSTRAHSTKQSQHAIVHYIAALAFEQKKLLPDALAELKMFLREEEDGPRAAAARKEMAALKAAMR